MGAPYSTSDKVNPKPASGVRLFVAVLLAALIVGLGYVLYNQNQTITNLKKDLATAQSKTTKTVTTVDDIYQYSSLKGTTIYVFTPQKNQSVNAPIIVTGTVPGNWSFEASFPIILKTSQGTVLAQSPAQLLGDWMTDKQVPFTLKLTFTTTYTGPASLILQKDNPSGLPQNDDSLTIPVVIK
jgi:hypothetical protein